MDLDYYRKKVVEAKERFRGYDPDIFGGEPNRHLIESTIGEDSPLGTVGVRKDIDISTTAGLMAEVDLTLLDKNASDEQVKAIATRAKDEGAKAVCVYPEHVAMVNEITAGDPPPIAVVGFPSVDDTNEMYSTIEQVKMATKNGAAEIDMVLPLSFRDVTADYEEHFEYINQVVKAANRPVKVILETAYLKDEQKIEASLLAKMAGAEFVKTSTGFAQKEFMLDKNGPKGATFQDVALMRLAVGDDIGVKASGGVRSRDDAILMYESGASRIGASGSIDLRTKAEKVTDTRGEQSLALGVY